MSDVIRDYIYVDVERLRSIYAQTTGSLTEEIITTENTSKGGNETESTRRSSIQREVLFATDQTKRNILHDYLFTEVEKQLESRLVQVSDETLGSLVAGSYILVKGQARIFDPARIIEISENINRLQGGAIFGQFAELIQKRRWEIYEELRSKKAKHEQDKLNAELEDLTAEGLMRKARKGVSSFTIDLLKDWLELVYGNVFEVTIVPQVGVVCNFRAITNPEYFREEPKMLYAKYGSQTKVEWALVGQITTILENELLYNPAEELMQDARSLFDEADGESKSDSTASEIISTEDITTNSVSSLENDEQESDAEEVSEQQNIRDSIEALFESLSGIERHLQISSDKTTYVVSPLAIFQESTI